MTVSSATMGDSARRRRASGVLADIVALTLTGAGYYFGARLGFYLRFPDTMHAILWPPNAILLAAFMLMPRRLWPWCILVSLPAHLAILLPGGVPWGAALGLFVTNNVQAVLGAVLCSWYAARQEGARGKTLGFILFGVFAVPFVVSFADVGVTMASGLVTDYWQAFSLRFLSNAASAVIFVPPIVGAVEAVRSPVMPRPRRLAEASVLLIVSIGLGVFLVWIADSLSQHLPLLICAYVPLLLWGAMRFGQAGASWMLLALALATLGLIAEGPPGIAGRAEILLQQALYLLVSIPVLYLSALHADVRSYMRRLDRAAERHDLAARAASIGVWEWNPTTDDVFVHPHLKALIGYQDREIPDNLSGWLHHYHPDDVEKVMAVARACHGGETDSFEIEHRIIHRDGSTRWLLSRGGPVSPRAGAKLVGTCVDVTERKRIDEELSTLRYELAHLTRVGMLGELSGAIAHEINQPLAAILSNAQAMERLLGKASIDILETREALKDIVQSAKRAGDMIHGLRDMLRKSSADFTPVDVNGVVGDVLNLAHSDLITHQVAVVRQLGSGIAEVRADRVQIQQVLLNFVMNACEAMDSMSERILTVATAARDERTIEISVSDTGPGIAGEVLERFFQPFTTTKQHGLGLGLSICHSLITAHGGEMRAENRAEGGAVFRIILPVVG
jgi:PAS domain S-box-containing protein